MILLSNTEIVKLFYDPNTNHSILCFPNEKPDNYIKGRIVKK